MRFRCAAWVVCWLTLATAGCGLAPLEDVREEPGEGPGGRRQPLALSPREELAVGRQAYQQVMREVRGRVLPEGAREVERVQRVMARLIPATEIEPLQREIGLRVRGYRFEWQVNVIHDRQVNAFCLPAGKIFVFTGILPVAANDAQLAAVLSHEMAHALAHHSSERVARERSGAGVLRALHYNRMQESEADHIGVFLMAFADYDPAEAVMFWRRMNLAQGAGGQAPEFLSDHPGAEQRIRDLSKWAPHARAAKQAFDEGRIEPAPR